MDSSDDEGRGESMVESTPRRSSAGSRIRTPGTGNRTPGRSSNASIPGTPFHDGNSIVPATPAARGTTAGSLSLTPLSGMEDNDDESMGEGNANTIHGQSRTENDDDDDIVLSSDEEGEVGNPPPYAHNDDQNDEGHQEDEDLNFLQNGQEDLPVVRGTTINIPTAAETFTHFLHNFRTLARARADNNDDGSESDSDDSMNSNSENRDPPMYMERLKSLLTQGAIHDSSQDGTTSPATSSLDIDTMHIYYHNENCQKFYQQLEEFPMELVPLMDLVVRRELEKLAATMARENDWDEAPHIPNIQVRPFNLRKVSNIRCLDPVAMDNLVSIKGMICSVPPSLD